MRVDWLELTPLQMGELVLDNMRCQQLTPVAAEAHHSMQGSHDAATALQAQQRGRTTRKNLSATKNCAVQVQKTYRGYSSRSAVAKKKKELEEAQRQEPQKRSLRNSFRFKKAKADDDSVQANSSEHDSQTEPTAPAATVSTATSVVSSVRKSFAIVQRASSFRTKKVQTKGDNDKAATSAKQ
jgi:hypothetical protein